MNHREILIIDDEASIRTTLAEALKDEGYRVIVAADGKAGLESIRENHPDVVLLDIWMPGIDGIETLKQIKAGDPGQVVIMMSGHGTIETAVRSTKFGAYDFIEKPLSLEKLLVTLANALSAQDLARENRVLRKQVRKQRLLVGESPQMRQLMDLIRRVAPTTGSVLITGENGTGKEFVAHGIHSHSLRFVKPFVEVNCAAIPEELIESELFGHEKGAFTGATHLRRGKFDLANGGTLFLDEIGDMSLKTQAKVLRILQEQKFERVGGTQTLSVDVRIVAATNKDLKAEIARNQFREDLYYRLNVIPIQVAPLRERGGDVALLAAHFLVENAQAYGRRPRVLSPEALRALENYSWPGNVRELRNLIERIIILTSESEEGQPVSAASILAYLEPDSSREEGVVASDSEGSSPAGPRNLRDARVEFEKDFIVKSLKENDWNISKTAVAMGIERSYLHRKIKSYGIESE